MPNLPPLPISVMPVQQEIPARLVYNVKDAAVLLGVGKDYLYERIKTGEIPIVQLGTENKSMRRIAATDLQAFIDSRKEVA